MKEYCAVVLGITMLIALVACDNRAPTLPAGLTYHETEVEFAYIDWAPDSKRLVGSSPDLGHPSPLGFLGKEMASEVLVWEPGADSYSQVSDKNLSMHNVNPVWHPSNDQILYYSEDEFGQDRNGYAGIVDANSLSRQAVVALGSQMDWSWNDSETVIANGDRVYAVSVGGGRPDELWSAPYNQLVVDLAVSPIGNQFAIVTKEVGRSIYRIFMVAVEGGFEQELFGAEEPVGNLAWSPDGKWLLFLQAVRPGTFRPIAIKSDGSCLTDPWHLDLVGNINDIGWSPNGVSIAAALFADRDNSGVLFADTDSEFVRDWLSSGSCGE